MSVKPMVLFFVGLFIGVGFGFLVCAVLMASKEEDAMRREQEKRERKNV